MITFPRQLTGMNGQDNISGLMQDVWLAAEEWFTAISEPLRSLGDGGVGEPLPDELVRITTDHTFDVTRGFIRCYTTDDTQSLEIPAPPGRDQNGSMAALQAFYPGNDEAAMGFFSVAPNHKWVVLVQTPNGKVIQLGRRGFMASVRAGYVTNNNTGERAGLPLTIDCFVPRIQFYEGVITPYPA